MVDGRSIRIIKSAIENYIAKPLGMSVPEAAYDFRIINNNMVDAIRVVSVREE